MNKVLSYILIAVCFLLIACFIALHIYVRSYHIFYGAISITYICGLAFYSAIPKLFMFWFMFLGSSVIVGFIKHITIKETNK